ncbi:hypothetical protein H2202_009712 [Exophiala xenobiotica]|nr:hypothetical protein H2202_009712 [Exophiala xenobiotica]KAK5203698.1 hypothetical protein LTR41_010578 [Exophiala xenobiotica]KAK5227853.1 hypothetical protein LTR47_008424 [Exophiala xenobiotica]KAK5253424.1 hypothetical protein LTS06_002135 [Exophiala xenobiotica]KAK5346672.1 hypothetical protein LTR61_009620 [Exophiala xenobiotica]
MYAVPWALRTHTVQTAVRNVICETSVFGYVARPAGVECLGANETQALTMYTNAQDTWQQLQGPVLELLQLYRGGANTIGKQHFTLLYSWAREAAFTYRNIKSGWCKTGLYPFNPIMVLRDIHKPPIEVNRDHIIIPQLSKAPRDLNQFQKLANAAEKAFADRALLLDEIRLLFEQNNENTARSSVKSIVVGTAKVMSYDDMVKAQQKRDAKEASTSK